ncbi:SDR family oxidoreductase [Thalassotalea sp. PLHSN55]|uniref:SDR family oxidoreductase n=1 Tax=Thalassotalea sp. PLHSN55 TaxID=3435888 RepID=UPI003F878534
MTTRLLITGGATGLGKALAMTWAKHNARQVKICIADIHQTRGEETVTQLTALGVDAFFSLCDITNNEQIDATVSLIKQQWQGLDVVINNAGVATGGSLLGESISQWQWVLDINLLGMVRVSQAVLPIFKQQQHGYFINIASQAGLTPIPFMNSYNAVKAAVIALSETMKLELVHDNIDVSVVCPSFFKTHLDESMRTSEPAMEKMMNRAFDKADISAEQVAERIYQQAQQRTFLILTHKLGKKAYLMKKLLPSKMYINSMLKRTKGTKRLVTPSKAVEK